MTAIPMALEQEISEVIPRNLEIRESIITAEAKLRQFLECSGEKQPECPLKHHFAPGAYGREIFIPKGTLLVGKIHKHAHLNMLMKGKVSVLTEEGPKVLEAPLTMVSPAGTKRAVYTHEDTVWVTVHLTKETDLEKIEDEIIAKSYEEFEAAQMKSLKLGETS
jgi:hypothetical protein